MRVLDRAQLLEPFLEKEVSEAIGVMKSNSAPGPHQGPMGSQSSFLRNYDRGLRMRL
jgi:hypothetical protein